MTMKRFKGHCTGSKSGQMPLHDLIIEAINPPQARQFLAARYPGYSNYYTSSEIR